MLHEISRDVAIAIPYKNEKERFYIEKAERSKNRHVEVWDKYIYSCEKWRDEDGKFRTGN